jgi:hypothetical protein
MASSAQMKSLLNSHYIGDDEHLHGCHTDCSSGSLKVIYY